MHSNNQATLIHLSFFPLSVGHTHYKIPTYVQYPECNKVISNLNILHGQYSSLFLMLQPFNKKKHTEFLCPECAFFISKFLRTAPTISWPCSFLNLALGEGLEVLIFGLAREGVKFRPGFPGGRRSFLSKSHAKKIMKISEAKLQLHYLNTRLALKSALAVFRSYTHAACSIQVV